MTIFHHFACFSVITVVEDWKLNSKYVQNFTVQVLVLPDGETYGSVLVNMTLNMIGMAIISSKRDVDARYASFMQK